ncbi:tail completion protein gp17 [Sediminibacillus massiliensis]|uniref:tail completion protein gp17 n=1 Tax=Sediminibacillus massiliensis TaxID=1926277 RepID=UPI000988444C|nr:DUF3168 domain-containing protein [Sediminibacillus massiliensis]
MKHIMTAIYQVIDNAHSYKTYQGRASQNGAFPYVVYKLFPVDPTESGRDDYTLEISCWDKGEGTSHGTVVEIAEQVRQSLLDFRLLDEHNLIVATRPSVGYVPDPDELIKRYDVTTTLLTYRR